MPMCTLYTNIKFIELRDTDTEREKEHSFRVLFTAALTYDKVELTFRRAKVSKK